MSGKTTQLTQVEGIRTSGCGDVHTGQSFVGDFARARRSRS